jgi:hypothetical protein
MTLTPPPMNDVTLNSQHHSLTAAHPSTSPITHVEKENSKPRPMNCEERVPFEHNFSPASNTSKVNDITRSTITEVAIQYYWFFLNRSTPLKHKQHFKHKYLRPSCFFTSALTTQETHDLQTFNSPMRCMHATLCDTSCLVPLLSRTGTWYK